MTLSIGFSVLNLGLFSNQRSGRKYRISCAFAENRQTDTIEHVEIDWKQIVENAFSTLAK